MPRVKQCRSRFHRARAIRRCQKRVHQTLKTEEAAEETRSGPRRRTRIPLAAKHATWSDACILNAKDDAEFVWTRALRINPSCGLDDDSSTLVASMTFNFAMSLHMTSLTRDTKPGVLQWTMKIYQTVLRLLPKLCTKLANRIKVAVYNNMASLQCRLLDYCEAFRWYAKLSHHMNSCEKEEQIIDRGHVVMNLILCCTPTVAGAA